MHKINHPYNAMVLLLIVVCLLSFNACEGTEARGKADRAVESLSGKEHIQQLNQMKSDIDDINKIQAERLEQMKQTK